MNIYDNEYISLQDMFYMFTILFSPKSLRKNLPRVTSASECPLLGSTKTSPKFLNGITIENWLQGKLPFQGRSYRSSGHHQTPFHHMLRRNLAVLLQSLEAVIRAAQGNHFITCMADKLKLYIYIPCNLWCDLTFMEAGNHNRSSLECVPKCSIDQGTEYAWPIFECATALAGAQHIWHWALTLLIFPFLLAQAFPFGQTIRTTPKFLRFHAFQRSMDEYLRFLLLVSPILRSWIILSPGYISNGWSSEPRAAHSSGKRV